MANVFLSQPLSHSVQDRFSLTNTTLASLCCPVDKICWSCLNCRGETILQYQSSSLFLVVGKWTSPAPHPRETCSRWDDPFDRFKWCSLKKILGRGCFQSSVTEHPRPIRHNFWTKLQLWNSIPNLNTESLLCKNTRGLNITHPEE